MKARDSLTRSKRFLLDEARRKAAQIETMVADLTRMSGELEAQIASEERRTGITDTGHFAYSTFALAARQRRDNLVATLRGLDDQRARAADDVADAEADLAALIARLDRDDERPPGGRDRPAGHQRDAAGRAA